MNGQIFGNDMTLQSELTNVMMCSYGYSLNDSNGSRTALMVEDSPDKNHRERND
jgi:hypothetical protein